MRRRASAASRAFCGAGHSIRLVGHHRQQVVGGVLRLAGCLKNGALVVAERGQPVLDIRGMVFAFLDLETDNRADEGCAQPGPAFLPRTVGAACCKQGFSVEAPFMPCTSPGLMRNRGALADATQ